MENEKSNDELNKNISRQFSTTSEKDALNGSVIQENFIPHEILSRIFCFLNPRELVICHLVCKKWNELIKEYVWRKKAELISDQSFHFNEEINWISYYLLCEKKSFNRNLLLSDKVNVKYDDLYKTIEFDKNKNPPPINVVPFPEDLVVNGKIRCSISPRYSYRSAQRRFLIDLLKEGFTEKILDNIQPIIKVSVWFSCKWEETKAEYSCAVKLKDKNIMHVSHFNRRLKDVNQRGRWLQYTQDFKNYGKGLRKIIFYDEGKQEVIIGGASIKLLVPELQASFDKINC